MAMVEARGIPKDRAAAIDRLVTRYEVERASDPAAEWILPPASCDFLTELASLFPEPPVALELGSGRSTHALRSATSQTISVEDSSEWLERTEVGASTRRPSDSTHVVPLRRLWNRGRLIESFDLESKPVLIETLKTAQLILVDSPPNPAKREHALFTALRHAPVGAVVVLDDLDVRAVDRFSQRLARQNRETFRFWKVKIDHHLGVFLKTRAGRIHSCPSLREFVGTWLRA